MAEELPLARGVEPDDRAERASVGRHGHLARSASGDPCDREDLASRQAERLAALFRAELGRVPGHAWDDPPLDPSWRTPDPGLVRQVEDAGGMLDMARGMGVTKLSISLPIGEKRF